MASPKKILPTFLKLVLPQPLGHPKGDGNASIKKFINPISFLNIFLVISLKFGIIIKSALLKNKNKFSKLATFKKNYMNEYFLEGKPWFYMKKYYVLKSP